MPNIKWATFYGSALATARALGEIGAVLIVSGSIAGSDRNGNAVHLHALEERQVASANVVALTLAAYRSCCW